MMATDDQEIAAFLLSQLDPEEDAPPQEVDEELIAGLMEGRLTPEMRDAVIRLLVQSRAGRELAAGWEAAAMGDASGPRKQKSWRGAALAAAAAVLIGLIVFAHQRGEEALSSGTLDARLQEAARMCRADLPSVFAAFEPLSPTERAQDPRDAERGGLRALSPRGTILGTQPTFRWDPAPGATTYRLSILDEQGAVILRSPRLTSHGWTPPADTLQSGVSYRWEVEALDWPLGKAKGQRGFRVAGEELSKRWRRAVARIDEIDDPQLRVLLRADLALRWDLLLEAERVLQPVASEPSAPPAVRETWRLVRRLLGAHD